MFATLCESESSFSAFRRLKRGPRATMTYTRLLAASICHVHKNVLVAADNFGDSMKLRNFRQENYSPSKCFDSF